MKDLIERIAALSSDKQALLVQQLKPNSCQPQPHGNSAHLWHKEQSQDLAQTRQGLPEDEPLSRDKPLPQCEWVVRYRQNDQARLRLFCFPFAGGGAPLFSTWHDALPPEIELCGNEELIQAMLPTLRADFELCDTYEYREEPPLACPFLIFGGLGDTRISVTDLEAWSLHSSVTSRLSMLPGNHFFLYSDRDLLLAAISQDLATRLSLLAGEEHHV